MRRMFSEKQIKEIAYSQAEFVARDVISQGIDPEDLYADEKIGIVYLDANSQGRVLESSSDDEGKIVGIDDDGTPALVEMPASGTKLYLHSGSGTDNNGYETYYKIISLDSVSYATSQTYPSNIENFISFENLSNENGKQFAICDYRIVNSKIVIRAIEFNSLQAVTIEMQSFDGDEVTPL